MVDNRTLRKQLFVFALCIGLLSAAAFAFFAATGSASAAAPVGANGSSADNWPTWPMGSMTPNATRTHEPTRTPCGDCSPTPTRCANWNCGTPPPHPSCSVTREPGTPMATRTHEPTRTPCGDCSPSPTRCGWNCGTPPPHPSGTRTPPPPPPTGVASVTPRPRAMLSLRPRLQFGRVEPGGAKNYHEQLLNRFTQDTSVDLGAESLQGWTTTVDPESLIVHPNSSDPVTVTVAAPVSPTFPVDIERVHASASAMYTTTAYLITFVGHHPFSDLGIDNWASDYVEYLVSQGAISGYSDGTFRPNDNVTRAQFAKMLVLAKGWQVQTPASPSFGDVASGYWAYGYIETAVSHGVISGYSDGTFRPGATVTRAQVAKMIVAANGWYFNQGFGSNFTDINQSEWAYSFADTVNAAGVMSGYSDGTFRPYASATRAQIAKILTTSLFSEPGD